jgi:hypothetical protein
MPRLPKSIVGLWSTDRGLTTLVGLLAVTVFVLPHLAPENAPLLSLLFDILFSLIVVAGLMSQTGTGTTTVLGVGLAVLTLSGRWLGRGLAAPEVLLVFNLSMSILTTLVLAWLVVLQVFREGPITMHRVLGAVGVYLLLGLAWAFAYHLMDAVNPAAFSISGGTGARLQSDSGFLYFSFVTLTTVGYGDITALDPAVRSVVILEALTGQLFPAILIARLVSMEIASRSR